MSCAPPTQAVKFFFWKMLIQLNYSECDFFRKIKKYILLTVILLKKINSILSIFFSLIFFFRLLWFYFQRLNLIVYFMNEKENVAYNCFDFNISIIFFSFVSDTYLCICYLDAWRTLYTHQSYHGFSSCFVANSGNPTFVWIKTPPLKDPYPRGT